MSIIESIESMLSRVKRFTWTCSTQRCGGHSSVSCLAFSVEEARERLVSCLIQIESLADEKDSVERQCREIRQKAGCEDSWNPDPETVRLTKQLTEQLNLKYPSFDFDHGWNYVPVQEYSRSMVVGYIDPTIRQYVDITIGDLILTTAPDVEEIRLIGFRSFE
jgi:hypothetical protein